MEHTFMTIHNLTPDANVLFVSDSIVDILGYTPDEVQGRSCFDYFHPDEVPFARSVHSRGILLDKAAVLHYARIRARDGQWISCECCFTIVHDVLVACTSIYRRGEKSERRAIEAPQIRRIFSCSPRDPRYHMLEHLSPKFKMTPMEREPRAALILNRFTRTLTVMFATNAVSAILGVRPDQIKGKSFYECIQENCLQDAIKCLESAKANDSIAYLRFWYRDPRREEDFEDDEDDDDEGREGDEAPNDGDDLAARMDLDSSQAGSSSKGPSRGPLPAGYQAAMPGAPGRPRREPIPSFELEAVVSCTSDGLVVVLRKARPPIPAPHPPLLPFDFENGLFAAPWGKQSITPYCPPDLLYTFRPPLLPQFMPLRENVKAAGGPPLDQLMKSIRDVAVFAWALVGINGNLAAYSHGLPMGEAQPPDGLPIWDAAAVNAVYAAPENQAARRWASAVDEGKGKGRNEGSHYNPDLGQPSLGFQSYAQSHPLRWQLAMPQEPGHSPQHPPFTSTLPHPHPPSFHLQQLPRQQSAVPGLAGGSYSTTSHEQFNWAEASPPFDPAQYRVPAQQPGHAILKPFYKWG